MDNTTLRYVVRESDPGYGCWDTYLLRWEYDAVGLSEYEAQVIADESNTYFA